MADHFKVFSSGDGRIFVILHPACGVDRGRILDLLDEAGFDPALVTFLTPEEGQEKVAEGQECTIIPIDENVTDAVELDEAARHRAQSGRVIVVLADGFTPDGLHRIAVKYGSQCGWSAGHLGVQITGPQNVTQPVDALGYPVERSRSDPVKC